MLGKIEGRRRRGQHRMRWLDGITNSMGMSLSKLWEMVKDREAWYVAVHGIAKSLKYIVQLPCCVPLFATPWTAARQASLSSTISWSLLKFMSIELVMLSNHLILCHLLFFLPSIFPSIRVFSSETALHISWPIYWGFSFSISASSEYSGLISLRMGLKWFHHDPF